MDDLGIPLSKVGKSAKNVIDRAEEEVKSQGQIILENEHLFVAFAQTEWGMFSLLLRDFKINPANILQSVEKYLHGMNPSQDTELRVSPLAQLTFKLALHNAIRFGRQTVESFDLFAAIFEEQKGFVASILKKHGVSSDVFISRIYEKQRELELRQEKLKKKFELPAFLNHFATNLNLLAVLDKISPVYGRDKEIQQI